VSLFSSLDRDFSRETHVFQGDRCRFRKTKCDGARPCCQPCFRNGQDCFYVADELPRRPLAYDPSRARQSQQTNDPDPANLRSKYFVAKASDVVAQHPRPSRSETPDDHTYRPGERNGHPLADQLVHAPPRPKLDFSNARSRKSNRSRERDLQALLAPQVLPNFTDQGPEPVFSDKALIVMALSQARPLALDLEQITVWIRNTFQNPRYKEPSFRSLIDGMLGSDSDFRKFVGKGFWIGGSPKTGAGVAWFLHPRLKDDLTFMANSNGGLFDPVKHVEKARAELVSWHADFDVADNNNDNENDNEEMGKDLPYAKGEGKGNNDSPSPDGSGSKALHDKSPSSTPTLEDVPETKRYKGTLARFAKWKKELHKKAGEEQAKAAREATGRALFDKGGWEGSDADDNDDEDGSGEHLGRSALTGKASDDRSTIADNSKSERQTLNNATPRFSRASKSVKSAKSFSSAGHMLRSLETQKQAHVCEKCGRRFQHDKYLARHKTRPGECAGRRSNNVDRVFGRDGESPIELENGIVSSLHVQSTPKVRQTEDSKDQRFRPGSPPRKTSYHGGPSIARSTLRSSEDEGTSNAQLLPITAVTTSQVSLRQWKKSEDLSRLAPIGETFYQELEDDEGLRGFFIKDDNQHHVQDQLHGSIYETRLDTPSPVPGHDVDHFVYSPIDNPVSRSNGIACSVLELVLEPQWTSHSQVDGLEKPLTEKALIVMAFGHTKFQDGTKDWKPAIRRISAQSVMQFYQRLPTPFRKRIASAYRIAAKDLYGSKAAHVHLTFHFVHERPTGPTHDLHQECRVAKDFHLGRDSISPRLALATSASVERHLMQVSKSMVYVNRVQSGLRMQTHRCLESDSRLFPAISTQKNRIRMSTFAHLTEEDEERSGRMSDRARGAKGKKRLRSSEMSEGRDHTEDRPTALRPERALPDSTVDYRKYRDSRLRLPAILTPVSLWRMSEPILSTLTGATRYYLEPPVPLGMKRIRWKCRCGKLIFDDYLEHKVYTPKSPAGVVRGLAGPQLMRPHVTDRTYRNVNPRTGAPSRDLVVRGVRDLSQQHGQDSGGPQSSRDSVDTPGSIWKSLGSVFKGFHASEPTLPQHDARSNVAKGTKPSATPKPNHLEFLLLCIPFKSHANKLMNIDTTTPPSSDIAFFRLLRQTYAKNRGRFRNLFSIRALSEIRFVQFEVFRNDLADVRKFDCIPPEAQKDNYLYRPMPAEFEPPIGKNQMRHLYDYPDHADDLPVCYSRVPRKLRERLCAAPGIGRNDGWGICFIEGVSWPRVCALGLAGVLASTMFGIVWTVVKDDIQGGFGVASYMLGVLVLGLGALQGAFEM